MSELLKLWWSTFSHRRCRPVPQLLCPAASSTSSTRRAAARAARSIKGIISPSEGEGLDHFLPWKYFRMICIGKWSKVKNCALTQVLSVQRPRKPHCWGEKNYSCVQIGQETERKGCWVHNRLQFTRWIKFRQKIYLTFYNARTDTCL